MRTTSHKRNGSIHKSFMMRLIGFAIVVALSVTSGFMLHANAMQRDEPVESTVISVESRVNEEALPAQKLSVAPGDTLWSIAEQYGSGNTKQYLKEIREANKLRTANLQVGQVLILP